MNTNELLTTHPPNVEVDAIRSLLGTELSACETYRTAVRSIEKEADRPALALRCLYRSHRRFAVELRGLVLRLGARTGSPPGTWGVWAGVHERIAAMRPRVDLVAALGALRHGERYSLELAEGALPDLEGPLAAWVKGRFLAGIDANLKLLAALQASVADESDGSLAS
jgi:hypothetical protein